jgi:pimeloyl-ACP methyl ester carboxylesterase
VALLLALAGCGKAGATPAAAPTTAEAKPKAGLLCPDKAASGTQVRFGTDGALAGIVFGSGTNAVVLAHQSNGDSCQMLPLAEHLTSRGYRVLVFDFPGYGGSDNTDQHIDASVVDAVAYLRGAAATTVTLVGASMGGRACIAAATEVTPAVAGVVALSAGTAPTKGADAGAAAPKLTVPALFVAADGDGSYAGDAATLFTTAGTPAAQKQKLIIKGSIDHGIAMVTAAGAEGAQVTAAVDAFLHTYAPVA